MRKSLTLIVLLAFFGAIPAFPQAKSKSSSELPAAEPFKINLGSSFDASPSKPGQQIRNYPGRNGVTAVTEDYSEAIEIIRGNHVSGDKLDYNELSKSSISSMLRTLDPHSNYFDPHDWDEMLDDQRSEYYGIGATIVNYQVNGQTDTYIVSTFPESPAYRANLRFGDKIVAVDGEEVNERTSDIVRDKIRGKGGTPVRVTVERADTRKKETVEMRRGRVPQPSIPDAYILRPGVGYVELSEGFNYTTYEELDTAIKALRDQGMKSLILDLRENPGGIVEQAVKVAERFLPNGAPILSQRGRTRIDNRSWKSGNRSPENIPLAVLVNDNSASASEIVAGALQDSDRALLVGEKTFGKGLVQSVISLPYGSGLTLTAARYFTPSGRSIQRDYSKMGMYDYFGHKIADTHTANLSAMRTITGRKVFGGDGIMPDEVVKAAELTRREAALLDPIFFFAREVVTGRVAGFESYKFIGRPQYGQRINAGNMPMTDSLLTAFENYLEITKGWNIPQWQRGSENAFIRSRLRYAMIMAAFGSVSANQVLIEEDPQVAKAVEALPRAQQLALAARRIAKPQ